MAADSVLTGALQSENIAMVEEVLECVRDPLLLSVDEVTLEARWSLPALCLIYLSPLARRGACLYSRGLDIW